MKNFWIILVFALVSNTDLVLSTDETELVGTATNNEFQNYYQDEFSDESILLVSWAPHPIDLWDYIVLNVSGQFESDSGRIDVTQFTKEAFPNVTLVFTCSNGDNAYFPNELNVPIIGVDAFQSDYYFQQYLNIIYTIHGFENPTELWEHFFIFQNAFEPVVERLSAAFQEYVSSFRREGKATPILPQSE